MNDGAACPNHCRAAAGETTATNEDDGVARVGALLQRETKPACKALAWAHQRVLPTLLALVSAGCQLLGDGAAAPHADDDDSRDDAAAELEALRADAIDAWGATLDRAGFESALTLPLLAGLGGDPDRRRASRRLRLDPLPAWPGGGMP